MLEVSKRKASTYFWSFHERFFHLRLLNFPFFRISLVLTLISLIYHEVLHLLICQLTLTLFWMKYFSFCGPIYVDFLDCNLWNLFLSLNTLILIIFFKFLKQLFLNRLHFRIITWIKRVDFLLYNIETSIQIYNFFLHWRIPMIFNGIVSSTHQIFCNVGPFIAHSQMW